MISISQILIFRYIYSPEGKSTRYNPVRDTRRLSVSVSDGGDILDRVAFVIPVLLRKTVDHSHNCGAQSEQRGTSRARSPRQF